MKYFFPNFLQQVYDGCQSWETAFIVQAYCSTDLVNDFGPTLQKAHEFIKNSQVECSLISLRNID
jgi:hypothetical protein